MLKQLVWLSYIMLSFGSIKMVTSDSKYEAKDAGAAIQYDCKLVPGEAKAKTYGAMSRETGQACINKCLAKKEKDDTINGVEMYIPEPRCWCIRRMTGVGTRSNFKSCLLKPKPKPAEPKAYKGWCLNVNGEDENAGTIRVAASNKDGCLAACQKNENAKGCEWEIDHCIVHTNQVCSGSGKGSSSCWVLNTKDCPAPAVDGQWSNWSAYSTCSKTCGAGLQKRTRSCDNPAPSHGGKSCPGKTEQSQQCNLKNCAPCPVNANTEKGECCVFPFVYRGRKYYECTKSTFSNLYWCGTSHESRKWARCKPVNGGWGAWKYGRCTCLRGRAVQRRERLCDNPKPANGGKNCRGYSHSQTRRCNRRCYG